MTSYRQSMKDTLQIMYDVREASLLERDLTPDEEKRREEIAKDLPDDDFKKRYGDKWMSVKMATATKMMKKEEFDLEEGQMKDLAIKGQDLESYAKKSGGIDKNDMMKVAGMLKRGDKSGAVKYAMKLDTDPKEYILNLIGEEKVEFKNFLEMFSPVHPTLKKELGTHGDHAIGMASTDKGVSVSFNKPKNVNDLKKQMSRHGYSSVTKVSDTTGKHKHVYHFQESTELDEAKMSASQIAALKKAYEPMRGKKMSMDSGNKLRSIMDKIDDDKQALIQLVKADIPFVSALAVTRLISKHDMKGAEINKLKEEVELDEVFNGTKKDIRKIARATDNALKKRSAQIQKMLKSKTNEKGRGLTDFEFDHISDEGDAIAAELVYRKKGGKDPISDDIPPHLKKFVNEEVELDEASAAADARRAMRRDPDMKQRAFSKDDSATDDDKKAASKNIMVQMRKAQSLGYFDVEFQDGKKIKIPAKLAMAVQQKYNAMRKPADKEKFQAKIGKSYRDMLNALKEEAVSPAQQAAIAISKKERGEKPKKESILDRIDRKIKENKNG